MSASIIQIVNGQDEPTGVATIEEAQRLGLTHRIVRIMVQDDDGNVLLQKRNDTMKTYPGAWDNSAAGHVDAGEDYLTAAKRELFEEIGLNHVELIEIDTFDTFETTTDKTIRRFNRLYTVHCSSDQEFELQADEVAEVAWFTIEQIKSLIRDSPDKVTDGIVEVISRYYS